MTNLSRLNKLILFTFFINILIFNYAISFAAVDIWEKKKEENNQSNEVNKKIDRSLKAGAMAMGANVRIRSIAGNLPMLQNKDINNIYSANASNIVGSENIITHPDDTSGGSTDMGDLSQIMPIIHPRSGGAIGAGHGNDYFIDDYYKSVINPAKAMATTIIDLLWHEENKLKEIISEHVPVYTKKEYIDLQKSRMGNEFHEYMKS